MRRASVTDWAKRVERWKDSGLTAKEFAAEMGINASTLSYWSWKLGAARSERSRNRAGKPERRAGVRAKRKIVATAAAIPEIVEVPVVEVIPSAPVLELVLHGDIRVRVPTGFDETTLRRLMRAVEEQA